MCPIPSQCCIIRAQTECPIFSELLIFRLNSATSLPAQACTFKPALNTGSMPEAGRAMHLSAVSSAAAAAAADWPPSLGASESSWAPSVPAFSAFSTAGGARRAAAYGVGAADLRRGAGKGGNARASSVQSSAVAAAFPESDKFSSLEAQVRVGV